MHLAFLSFSFFSSLYAYHGAAVRFGFFFSFFSTPCCLMMMYKAHERVEGCSYEALLLWFYDLFLPGNDLMPAY